MSSSSIVVFDYEQFKSWKRVESFWLLLAIAKVARLMAESHGETFASLKELLHV